MTLIQILLPIKAESEKHKSIGFRVFLSRIELSDLIKRAKRRGKAYLGYDSVAVILIGIGANVCVFTHRWSLNDIYTYQSFP
jgi:hypothetical protein